MSPIASNLALLALASTVLAVPHGEHLHQHQPRWRWRTTTTTAVATSTSDAVVSVATSTTTSAAVVPVATSTTVAPVAISTTSSAVVAATSSAAPVSKSGKRGAAYNDASLVNLFANAPQVTWAYNWGQYSSGLASGFDYVPMLWGSSSTWTNGWSAAAQSAINAGSTHLLSFNEPDLGAQANLSPAAAAAAYKTYMQPFAGKAKLGSPAVTNGANGMGLDWLSAFLAECSGCTIDFVPIHWYSGHEQAAYFKSHVANATAVAGGRPVWVTEFGCTTGSASDISSFLQDVMPWMDSQSYVERYSYFMVAVNYLLSSTTALSSYGSTFMSYTA